MSDDPRETAPVSAYPAAPEPAGARGRFARLRSSSLGSGRGLWLGVATLAVLLVLGVGGAAFAVGDEVLDHRRDASASHVGHDSGDDGGDDGEEDGGHAATTNTTTTATTADNGTPLTGSTLSRVTAAVQQRYPGATVTQAYPEDDGGFEAHATTTGGQPVTVRLDSAFAVTGTENGH